MCTVNNEQMATFGQEFRCNAYINALFAVLHMLLAFMFIYYGNSLKHLYEAYSQIMDDWILGP
jgi:hypothetical protein